MRLRFSSLFHVNKATDFLHAPAPVAWRSVHGLDVAAGANV
jgi:hypothetical protein